LHWIETHIVVGCRRSARRRRREILERDKESRASKGKELYSLYMTGDRFSWEKVKQSLVEKWTFRDDKTLFPLPWESGTHLW
jgi:hypothetical protein